MLPENRDLLTDGLRTLGLYESDADGPLVDELVAFHDHLQAVNAQFNLTGLRDERDSVRKNLLDSLAPWRMFNPDAPLCEVGAGGGMPGFPLAIALPFPRVILLESKQKKCRFLEETAALLPSCKDRVSVVCGDANDPKNPRRYEQLVFRAFGSMEKVAKVCAVRLAPTGRALVYKGREETIEQELAALPAQWREGGVHDGAPRVMIEPVTVPTLEDEQRHLVILFGHARD